MGSCLDGWSTATLFTSLKQMTVIKIGTPGIWVNSWASCYSLDTLWWACTFWSCSLSLVCTIWWGRGNCLGNKLAKFHRHRCQECFNLLAELLITRMTSSMMINVSFAWLIIKRTILSPDCRVIRGITFIPNVSKIGWNLGKTNALTVGLLFNLSMIPTWCKRISRGC